MNLDPIENLLVGKLGRLLRKQADVLAGPVSTLVLGGMQETVFVHAARFEDHNGITPDGASIARRPLRNGRVSGIAEERPCLLVVEVTCVATAYSRIKALCREITPEILLVLACEREFELGASDNRQSSLRFTDFQACLNRAETNRREDDGLVFHLEQLVFHINGALHVQLSKYGGLKAKQSVREKPVKKIVKKPATKSRKKPNTVKPVKKPEKTTRKQFRKRKSRVAKK
jgi:hypothetical protein